MSLLGGVATSVLTEVIENVLKRPNVPVSNAQAPQVAREVAAEVGPIITNKTNAEPWYQSRIFWVQIIAIFSGVASLLWGFEISPEDRELILAVVIAVNGLVTPLLTLYSRFKKGLKPLPIGDTK